MKPTSRLRRGRPRPRRAPARHDVRLWLATSVLAANLRRWIERRRRSQRSL